MTVTLIVAWLLLVIGFGTAEYIARLKEEHRRERERGTEE